MLKIDPNAWKALWCNQYFWREVLIFVVTTIILIALGWWLSWVHQTHHWGYLCGVIVVLVIYCWRYWDYHPPGD